MVGRHALDVKIGVRIPVPEQKNTAHTCLPTGRRRVLTSGDGVVLKLGFDAWGGWQNAHPLMRTSSRHISLRAATALAISQRRQADPERPLLPVAPICSFHLFSFP